MNTGIQAAGQEPSLVHMKSGWKSPGQIKQRIVAIQELMSQVLKPGTKENDWSGDYGIIPGTGNKPSLWKSGSEQILAMFEIAVDPVIEDLSSEDCYRYRVTARLIHAPTGNFLGAGVGEASTDETKYKWRKTYVKQEFDATPVDRRRMKYSQYKDNNGMWTDKAEMQIRQEPADLANTVLKMAKKRAQIDATLTVTGASSMFDQDLEDLSDEAKQGMSQEREKTKGKGKKAVQEKAICAECRAEGGHLPSCKYNPKNQQTKQEPAKTEKSEAKPAPKATKEVKVAVKAAEDLSDKKGNSYLRLTVLDEGNRQGFLYVRPNHLREHLEMSAGANCILEISASVVKGKDEKGAETSTTYYSVEHIHQIGFVRFENDKPVGQVEHSEEGPEPTAEEMEKW